MPLASFADGLDRAGRGVEGNERGFADDDTAASSEDAGIGGAEIDGQVCRKGEGHIAAGTARDVPERAPDPGSKSIRKL